MNDETKKYGDTMNDETEELRNIIEAAINARCRLGYCFPVDFADEVVRIIEARMSSPIIPQKDRLLDIMEREFAWVEEKIG
jgi:hypothetical protein